MIERTERVCSKFGEKVIYREIDTSRREAIPERGSSDALFMDEKNIYRRPPLTYDKLRKIIENKVKKLQQCCRSIDMLFNEVIIVISNTFLNNIANDDGLS